MDTRTLHPRTLLAALLMTASLIAYAPHSRAAGSERPCTDDVAKFCKDVQRGGGRIAACLKQHESDLTPACREHVAKSGQRMRQNRDACRDDMQQHCKDVKPGQGRIAACLKQHEAELSPVCKEHLAKPQGQRS